MQGPVSATDVLIGAQGLSDFLDRQYYVEQVMVEDADLLWDLRAAQREVVRERRQVLARRAELAAAHQENFGLVADAGRQAADYEGRRKVLLRERAAQEAQFRELEEDSREVQRSLEREVARRMANPRSFQALPRWGGQLFRPTAGRFGSGFGPRYHPILHYTRMHNGVDIGGKQGQPVYAAASGEVFHASWRGGYGKCIILLHGGEMSTLYAHLSAFNVRLGQRVTRGQLIGAVGSTGLSTAPHLHFEVRRNGRPVNPL
jgi:murein DD-endopeptidase MepM/ murein hydrolase activator NlpD